MVEELLDFFDIFKTKLHMNFVNRPILFYPTAVHPKGNSFGGLVLNFFCKNCSLRDFNTTQRMTGIGMPWALSPQMWISPK